MANVTRIKNNQITDSTITYQKIVPGTLVGSLFNANLTLNSNVSIIGNLTVAGYSSSVSSTNTYVNDPLVVFNNGYTGSLSGYDIGILINRNLSSLAGYTGGLNTAWIWNEAEAAFVAITTTDTGGGVTNLNNSGYANVRVGNLIVATANVAGNLIASSFVGTLYGDVYATNGVITNFSSSNVLVTGGALSGVNGAFTTLTATNFSSGNARISGGYADAFPIGANTAATGKFTSVTDTALTQGRVVIVGASGLLVDDSTLTYTGGTLTASNLSTGGTVTATNGSITNLATTTGVVTNFSSGNAQITGGDISGVDAQIDTGVITNFSTGNAQITGGNLSITNATFTNLTATNFSSGNVLVTGGDLSGVDGAFGTLTATNFSTGNAQVTGGNGAFTTLATTNFSTANAQITGGDISGVDAQIDTGVVTNFSSGNAQISGGNGVFTTIATTNFGASNVQVTGGDLSGVNGAFTTLTATNFSSGNAQLTGGNGAFTTLTATNFSTANAMITGGDISGVDAQIDTGVVTNFSTANAKITGGDISGVNAQINTGVVTNFSSGNARISGGYADNFPIGANTAATGAFTSLSASGQTSLTNTTNSYSAGTGALTVAGGVGITKDLYVGGNLIVANIITENTTTLVIQDPLVYQVANVTYPYDYDIGLYSNFVGGPANVYAHSGMARNYLDGSWGFFSNVKSEPTSVVPWTDTGIIYDPIKAGELHLTNSTPSTSTTTGALTVAGGAGIVGNLYAGAINTGSLTASSINNTMIGNGTPSSGTFTYLTATTGFATGNAVITGGSLTGVDGAFTTLTATNFSTGNALISGGSITGVNEQVNTGVVNNFSSGNAQITGGNISNTNAQFNTATATNFSSGNAQIFGGNAAFATTTSTNFSTANAKITGGDISNINAQINTGVITNFSTANAKITGGDISGVNAQINTGVITNFSTGNAQITGGNSAFTTLATVNFSTGNALITGGDISGVDAQIDTGVVTNFSTANAKITGGSLTGLDGAFNTLTATNFSTGNALITGGDITNTDAQLDTAVVTNFSTANAKVTGGNVTNINAQINTGVVTNFSTANALITGGSLSNLDGAFNTLYATNFSTANAKITGSNIDNTPIGDNTASTAKFTTLSASGLVYVSNADEAITSNIGSVVLAGGLAVNKQIQVGGNLVAASTADSTSTTTGSFVSKGGAGIASNVVVGKGLTVNSTNNAGGDLRVRGVNTDTLIWARPNATYDQVLIGNTATTGTLVPGAKLQINSTDSILLPVGTNAQRPSGVGQTDVTGMLRFSTTSNAIEWYNGTQWANASTTFTIIVDQQFNGDDSTVNFTLSQAATTNGIIVSINGVVQIPTLAYAVGGVGNTTLTFTEAPATGDVIDVRILTTTQSVTALASANGYMQIAMNNTGIDLSTGTSSSAVTTSWEPSGAEVSKIAAVNIASSGVTTTIDSFDKATYRTAKYILQASISGSYHSQEVLVVHDGSTATAVIGTAAVTGSSLGTPSVTISGSNVLLQFNATNNNTAVRVKKEYIVV